MTPFYEFKIVLYEMAFDLFIQLNIGSTVCRFAGLPVRWIEA
jgi:hypothetical protein